MKLEVGKFYKTKLGSKVEIVRILNNPHNNYPCIGIMTCLNKTEIPSFFSLNGKLISWPSLCDIVSEWKEPVEVSGWVNIYPPNGRGDMYTTKEEADRYKTKDRIACIYVTGTEEVEP